MKSKSEGFNRLSIVIGVIASLLWLVFILFGLIEEGLPEREELLIFFVFIISVTILGFLFVRGILKVTYQVIYWIYEGFIMDSKKKKLFEESDKKPR